MVLITIIISACKKKNDILPPNNNEVNATVAISSTSTIMINSKGSKAKLGCSFSLAGISNFVSATSENGAAVYINIPYRPAFSYVTSSGTYDFACEYRQKVGDPNTPIWSNVTVNGGNIKNPGSITFTVINDHYWEGYFNAFSKCGFINYYQNI